MQAISEEKDASINFKEYFLSIWFDSIFSLNIFKQTNLKCAFKYSIENKYFTA